MVEAVVVADSVQVGSSARVEVWFRKQCFSAWFTLESSRLVPNAMPVANRFSFTWCEHHRAAQVG
jgi:hypothetical protein